MVVFFASFMVLFVVATVLFSIIFYMLHLSRRLSETIFLSSQDSGKVVYTPSSLDPTYGITLGLLLFVLTIELVLNQVHWGGAIFLKLLVF